MVSDSSPMSLTLGIAPIDHIRAREKRKSLHDIVFLIRGLVPWLASTYLAFGDVWCRCDSPSAPRHYNSGAGATIHSRHPGTWSSVRQGREVPGTIPTRVAYT